MLRSLRLTTALLVALAGPAWAQSPSAQLPTTPGHAAGVPPAGSSTAPNRPPSAGATAGRAGTLAAAPVTSTPTARPASPSASAGAAATPAPANGKIDVNAASAQELDALPGIGPALAQQIIAGRPWDDLNDLVKKKALPQGVFDRNKDRLALANINTSSAADLAKTLPGIGEVRSRAIVNGRPYAQPQDLVSKKILTQNQFEKIKDLVAY